MPSFLLEDPEFSPAGTAAAAAAAVAAAAAAVYVAGGPGPEPESAAGWVDGGASHGSGHFSLGSHGAAYMYADLPAEAKTL